MTPKEWQTTEDVYQLERALFHPDLEGEERKWMLFGAACCRRTWDLIPEQHCRKTLEAAEKFALGIITHRKFEFAVDTLENAWEDSDMRWLTDNPFSAAANAIFKLVSGVYPDDVSAAAAEAISLSVSPRKREKALANERAVQADLLRDIFGHPSRLNALFGRRFPPLIIDPTWLTQNKGAAQRLARSIHDDQRFGDMPLLAVALKNAGCTDETILSHCRGPGPHVWGCWLLEALLGREPDGEWELEYDA